jgi:hypothetical protein
MPTDPSHNMSDVVGDAIDEIEEVIEELADDVGELVGRLRDDLLGRDGYLIVLVMTIVVVVAIPIDASYWGGGIVTVAAIGLLVLTAMSRSKVSHRLRVASGVVIAISFVLAATYTVMIGLCFPAILRHAFTHSRISLNTVAAALSAYLMIGLIFTSMFRFVEIVAPPFFTQPNVNPFTYEYFSFITLATVGYGDFSPANDAGRTLAMLEGVFGQIFLVTIVALVVSNLGVERGQLRRTMADNRPAVAPPAPTTATPPTPDPADGPPAGPPG